MIAIFEKLKDFSSEVGKSGELRQTLADDTWQMTLGEIWCSHNVVHWIPLDFSSITINVLPFFIQTGSITGVTLLCFFKFVSRANNSKSCPPNNWPRIKNVAIYIFLEQTTLQTCGFWAVEALEAWIWDYLNITLAQKWHSDIFQISAEKSFQAWKKKFSVLIEWM